MSQVDLSKYKELYLQTSVEQLSNSFVALKDLEENPSDKNALIELYRNVHTIATKSLMMGYWTTGALCRQIEYICKYYKDTNIPLDTQLLEDLKNAMDHVHSSLTSITEKGYENDVSSFQKELQDKTQITVPELHR